MAATRLICGIVGVLSPYYMNYKDPETFTQSESMAFHHDQGLSDATKDSLSNRTTK
jgi:hypothetical protein